MTFIVIFVALMIERFFDWSHTRVWFWFGDFQQLVVNKLKQPSSYVNLAVSILPVLLVVWLINHIFHGWMYGFPSVIFKVLVLLYCLGPHNFWADAFASINAVKQGDSGAAGDRLRQTFGINPGNSPQTLHKELLGALFIAANRRIFAVIFWYILLGPVGVVAYRLVAISTGMSDDRDNVVPALSQSAQLVETVMDWAPARVITMFFALGGQFIQVLTVWRQKAPLGLYTSDDMMTECGMAALGVEQDTDFPADCKLEQSAVSLVDRSLVMILVILALVTFF